MTVLELLTPRKRPSERTAVLQLARVLYQAHSTGWGSLSLTSSYSRPSETSFSGSVSQSGGVVLKVGEESLLITQGEYEKAARGLNTYYRACLRAYYQRKANKFDTCPSLEESTRDQQLQYAAFKALYALLVVPAQKVG